MFHAASDYGMVASMKLRDAARAIVESSLADVHARRKQHPDYAAPRRNGTPTPGQLWSRYCHAVVTSRQPISDDWIDRTQTTRPWLALADPNRMRAPRMESIRTALQALSIRDPVKKANWIRAAWYCDRAAPSTYAQSILQHYHDSARPLQELREVERHVARRLVDAYRGYGVGHKIARLMMIWDPTVDGYRVGRDFHNVIPLDSRWLARLRTHGVNVETFELQQEARYLEVEDELCRAAFEYDVRPSELDQSVFHSDGQ